MPNFSTLFKLLKYAPTVISVVKQFRGQTEDHETRHLVDAVADTRDAMNDFKHQMEARLADVEEENAKLRSRVREMESSATMLRAIYLFTLVFAITGFVLAAIALLR